MVKAPKTAGMPQGLSSGTIVDEQTFVAPVKLERAAKITA
jgi:hypothetical protein